MTKCFIYGRHTVEHLLNAAPHTIKALFLLKELAPKKRETIVVLAQTYGIPCHEAHRATLDRMTDTTTHQGIVADVVPHSQQAVDEKGLMLMLSEPQQDQLLLALDGVLDPQNLGACVRTACAAGATALLLPSVRTTGMTPTARKAACGAAEILPVVPVKNLVRALQQLKDKGFWVIGTDPDSPNSIYQQAWIGPTVLVMGAEGTGMHRLTQETCDSVCSIPMPGKIPSLNVSAATAVCCFEWLRKRLSTTP